MLIDSTNTRFEVWLHGIDCLEKGQAYYYEAIEFVREHTKRKSISVEITAQAEDNCILGYVYADDTNINKELLKEGLAWYYKEDTGCEEMAEMEADARHRQYNIWSKRNPVAPWDYRNPKPEEKGRYTAAVIRKNVYICKDNSKLYHRTYKCPELTKYKSEISKLDHPYTSEMTPCMFCYIHNRKGRFNIFFRYGEQD